MLLGTGGIAQLKVADAEQVEADIRTYHPPPASIGRRLLPGRGSRPGDRGLEPGTAGDETEADRQRLASASNWRDASRGSKMRGKPYPEAPGIVAQQRRESQAAHSGGVGNMDLSRQNWNQAPAPT